MDQPRILDSDRQERVQFAKQVWPLLPDDVYQDEHYIMYFQHVDQQIKKLQRQNAAYSVSTRHEVSRIFEYFQQLPSTTKSAAINSYASSAYSLDSVSRVIELAATVWLTVRVDSVCPHDHGVNGGCIAWQGHLSLGACIQSYFEIEDLEVTEGKRNRIPRSFTMAHLCRRYGFRVIWTNNLADHLIINWEHKIVTIYEHLICLWNHCKYTNDCHIPQAILEEAIDTINLLFPSDKADTQAFLRITNKSFWKLGYCERQRCMQLSGYHYWRGSIQQLMEVLDDPPTGFNQISLDKERRNFVEWATFWVAFIVALLTIISIVFGIVSIVYAVKSYDIAIKSLNVGIAQLELASAQACAAPDAATDLPQFCAGK
ncbi:hypothetical protein F5B20DRAFT_563600 [Whalleya microplaca]|nr:hypothetical protein F5B20DRAFT_563600 [Whalleya microplaca]